MYLVYRWSPLLFFHHATVSTTTLLLLIPCILYCIDYRQPTVILDLTVPLATFADAKLNEAVIACDPDREKAAKKRGKKEKGQQSEDQEDQEPDAEAEEAEVDEGNRSQ
jgi:hypothetical protein